MRTTLAILVIALVSGCAAEHKVYSASGEATVRPTSSKAAPVSDKALLIEADGAGPIHLGMSRETALKLPGLAVSPATLRLQGSAVPVVRFENSGEALAIAELKDNHLSRIRVLSPRFATPEGVHVGSDAHGLGKRYGAGKVFTGAGTVCAAFAKASGLIFCFRSTPDLLKKADWQKVVARNPVVEVIQVVPVR